ncbi:hypothetical protein GGD54_006354 [Rhizobium tropici]|uniref:Uncharacterized protein n=2 Tax=Rhizobium TaxID=379 RepID=A0ABR6R8G7_RHITR|nr:hypothetical protein [Rhizobium tropici]MBB5596531.1 hypothetical protein [Rhizobium tropici]MBB6489259.1 hypothetical protein [Rhizobium lusitanum]MBB6495479.1 hypothetical protein [Rhizobium tropici]
MLFLIVAVKAARSLTESDQGLDFTFAPFANAFHRQQG